MDRRLSTLCLLCLPVLAAAQNHPITIHANQRVVSLQMSPAEYSDWIQKDEFESDAKREALVQDIYRKFNDEFDFIFLVLNEEESPANIDYAGQLISISNKTAGLGNKAFDYAKDYGSAGRLKSVMALTGSDYVMSGPSLHELMHTWGNFGIQTAAFDPFGGGGAISNFKPHWGFTGGNVEGQLGGFKQSTLVENVGGKATRYKTAPFGQFANGGNGVPYSEFELYLMGMLPSAGVAAFDVFRGITAYDDKTNEFEAATRVRYDQARIVSELGERIPASAAAQKDFRLLIVVLCGAPLTASEWAAYDKDSEAFGKPGSDGSFLYNFWEATGGRGTMETGKLNSVVKGTSIFTLGKPRNAASAVIFPGDPLFTLTGRRIAPRRDLVHAAVNSQY